MISQDFETRNMGCGCNPERNCQCHNNIDNNNYDDMNTARENMIHQIKSYQFAITELALYLDTHPDEERALCLHRKYTRELKDLKDKYQKVYGPLTIEFPCNKWRWLEEPWPWERGNF